MPARPRNASSDQGCGWVLSMSAVCCIPRPTDPPPRRGQSPHVAQGLICKTASGRQADMEYFGLVLTAVRFLAHTICFQLRNNGLAKHQPLMAGIKG